MLLNDFIQVRGCSACFNYALNFFGRNISTIIKKTWLVVLVMALFLGISSMWCFNSLSNSDADFSTYVMSSFVQAAGSIVLGSVVMSHFLSYINKFKKMHNFAKCIITHFIWMVITLIGIILFALLVYILIFSLRHIMVQSYAMLLGLNIISITIMIVVTFLFVQPIIYTTIGFWLEPQNNINIFWGNRYRVGFHNKWFLLRALLTLCVSSLAIIFVCCAPLQILMMSIMSNKIGMLGGDANGLPSYFNFIVFFAIFVQVFFCCYIGFFYTTYLLYVYGSVEAKLQCQ